MCSVFTAIIPREAYRVKQCLIQSLVVIAIEMNWLPTFFRKGIPEGKKVALDNPDLFI
jgi:hypothetical protein